MAREILSGNEIPFEGIRKNIEVGFSGWTNAHSAEEENSSYFRTIRGTKLDFLITQGCFFKRPTIF